jgi:SAM-dependent methyltransferase
MRLPWNGAWDVVFLLDVLEHLPDDAGALREVHRALAPGGLVFVTVPALRFFWSWNDDAIGHQRRYARGDLVDVAQKTGFEVLDARYFMFLLSPMLLASRILSRPRKGEDAWQRVAETHTVPIRPVNEALSAIFGAESPMGHVIRFPWGTSALAVLERGSDRPAREIEAA